MTRLTLALVAFASAIPCSWLALAQTNVGCTIVTPSGPLIKDTPYKVVFTNCKGNSPISLRSGVEEDMVTDPVPACATLDLTIGSCMFTPTQVGTFEFSAIDGSGVETFSGDFTVA